MKISGFRFGLAFAAMFLVIGCGSALAQEKKTPQVFNSTSSGSKETAPIFLKKQAPTPQGIVGGVLHKEKAYGMQSHSNSPSSPENVEKARIAFEQAQAKQRALNKQNREARMAVIRAEFEAQKAKDIKISQELKLKNMAQAGTKPGAPEGTAQPGMSKGPDPYQGSNVVFTGKKKTGEEKPVRLFNTR